MTSDSEIRDILTSVKTIALVGWSPKPDRPSHGVAAFLKRRGYRVIPVNPGQAGQQALGETVVANLAEAGPVDMVDIFRNSEAAAAVVDEALSLPVLPKVIWMQLGVSNDAAAAKAEAAGVKVVMNRCPKIEYARLTSEIQWVGVNSRTISAKRAPIPTSNMRLSLNRSSVTGGATMAADRAAKDKNDLP